MQEMTLAFPDTLSMADFVIGKNVGGIIVDSKLNTVRGDLSDGLIATACKEYDASLLNNHCHTGG